MKAPKQKASTIPKPLKLDKFYDLCSEEGQNPEDSACDETGLERAQNCEHHDAADIVEEVSQFKSQR